MSRLTRLHGLGETKAANITGEHHSVLIASHVKHPTINNYSDTFIGYIPIVVGFSYLIHPTFC